MYIYIYTYIYIYNYLKIPMLLIRSFTKGIPQRLRLPGFSFKFAYCYYM